MTHQLTQKLGSITRQYELGEDGRLTITVQSRKAKDVSTVQLREISEDSRQVASKGRIIDRQVLAGFVLVIIFAMATVISFQFGSNSTAAVLLLISLLIVFWTVKAFKRLRAEAYDIHVFSHRNGGPDAFLLGTNLPDPESFTAFASQLRRTILRFKPRDNSESTSDIAAALQDLDRLYSTGALLDSEFQAAKSRVLAGQLPRPVIGFGTH